jgi:hypothetical protein
MKRSNIRAFAIFGASLMIATAFFLWRQPRFIEQSTASAGMPPLMDLQGPVAAMSPLPTDTEDMSMIFPSRSTESQRTILSGSHCRYLK